MTQSTLIGQFEESEARERLIAQRHQKLIQALHRYDWHFGTAEYRIAMMFFHLSKVNQKPILKTNPQIAADASVATGDHALTVKHVSRAIGNLRRAGIVIQRSAKQLQIPTHGRSNVQARSIDFGRVYCLAEGGPMDDLAAGSGVDSATIPPIGASASASTRASASVSTSASARASTSASALGPDTYIPFIPISTSSKESDSRSISQEDLRAAADNGTSESCSRIGHDLDMVCQLLRTKLHPKTVRDLRDAGHLLGLTVGQVKQLIVEFDAAVAASKLFSNGSLKSRIEDGCWPHDDIESYDAIVARQQAKVQREQQKAASEALKRQRELEAESRNNQLRRDFLPVLQAMSIAQRDQLAERCLITVDCHGRSSDFNLQQYRKGMDFTLELLEALESEACHG